MRGSANVHKGVGVFIQNMNIYFFPYIPLLDLRMMPDDAEGKAIPGLLPLSVIMHAPSLDWSNDDAG